MRTIEIDYNQWRCGEHADPSTPGHLLSLGSGTTALATPTQEHGCCCVGLMLLSVGVPREVLLGRASASCVRNAGYLPEGEDQDWLFGELTDDPGDHVPYDCVDSPVATRAYNVNDGVRSPLRGDSTTVAQRMRRLTDIFEQNQVAFLRWQNVPDDIMEEFHKSE